MAFDAVNGAEDPSVKRNLLKNICISGGLAKYQGFEDRFKKELKKLAPDVTIKTVKGYEPMNSVWMGGSIVASMTERPIITKEVYDEVGPSLIHDK